MNANVDCGQSPSSPLILKSAESLEESLKEHSRRTSSGFTVNEFFLTPGRCKSEKKTNIKKRKSGVTHLEGTDVKIAFGNRG